ncbi:MAG: flagellar hook-basal body complex protein, partial [Desulfovibrionaceae bacterium]|nr:flagellar hook-basal body complex protein [Desulfovibrionaceae bacterium]
AVSGLLRHGDKMSVIGNNISNVNTVGFKSQRMDFADFVYQDVSSSNGTAQVGRGVTVSAIMGDFSQGASEASNTVTDISITGNGFFKVRNPNAVDEHYYTRAGNFRFNSEGELLDPNGYVLQGWEIERADPSIALTATATSATSKIKGSGVPKDIKLGTFTCQPQHTNSITVLDRLKMDDGEKSIDDTDPFFSLLKTWDASDPENMPPLGDNSFTHQTTVTVYDEAGAKHNLTIYFDKVENIETDQDISNTKNSEVLWEFIVTMDPLEDIRQFYADDGTPYSPTDKSRGLLMAGTLTMSTNGVLQDMSAFVPYADNPTAAVDLNNLGYWVEAPMSVNGVPMLTANFSGVEGLSSVYTEDANGNRTINSDALPYMIEMDFGVQSKSKSWNNAPAQNATQIGNNRNNLMSMGAINSDGNTTVGVADTSTSNTQQDGYGFGYLQNIQIDKDGVLSVRYDNGVTLELWQITLYDFINTQGLYREGNNLYSENRESGSPTEGAAGTTGLGQVYSNSLEMSNVDIATEFVYMIATQRGYQANSKMITTVDTMLEQVINMKR